MSVTTFASETFPELGTRHVVVTFYDESGNNVTPNLAKYTLTTLQGVVVNSLEDVSIVLDSAGTATITLSDDDLQILSTEDALRVSRVLTVYYEYDSTYGTDLPERAVYQFEVENLVGVG